MVKIVEFQERAIERLEGFRSNAAALPSLVYARYLAGQTGGITSRVKGMNFALRKNKQHIMHAQHRANCIEVLSLLFRRLDVRTRQCVYVNPKHNIRRNIYVPEIARLTQLCDRTITRCLGSLERAGYLLRTATPKGSKMFLSLKLMRELNISLMFERLVNQLNGLKKKNQWDTLKNGNAKPQAKAAPGTPKISQRENLEATLPGQLRAASDESRNIGNTFLESLGSRRRRRPPPD